MMSTISEYALQGIHRGMKTAHQSAQTIASESLHTGATGETVTNAIIDLKNATQQVAASAKVIKTENEMLGSIFDDFA